MADSGRQIVPLAILAEHQMWGIRETTWAGGWKKLTHIIVWVSLVPRIQVADDTESSDFQALVGNRHPPSGASARLTLLPLFKGEGLEWGGALGED